MFRYVTLLGVACLAVAAVALASVPKALVEQPVAENDRDDRSCDRLAFPQRETLPAFHARFSLN